MTEQFIPLHIHTEYSIIDGVVRLDALIARAVEQKIPALAITDHANLFGLVKFYKAALKAGIKPIVGSEVWVENQKAPKKPYQLVLLCQNQTGYKNLIKLISKAYVEGQHDGKAIIRLDWFRADRCEGLIALSSGCAGDIGQMLLADKEKRARERLQFWMDRFPNRFYLELHRVGHHAEDLYIKHALALSEEYNVPVVATNNTHFLSREDFESHEARVCIHEGWLLSDTKRPHFYTEQQYLRSPAEMIELFADIPEAIENTVEIAKRCNVVLELNQVCLPKFPVPEENLSLDDYFVKLAREGFEKRLARLLDVNAEDFAEKRKPYDARLQREIDVIVQMGFAGYFLIVADFIQWSKENGVPVGPGRGSGAGSLVAYSLKITDLDPLEYDLLFERFLNPERVSMPDFDVDFCMDGRDRVIEYVTNKYGHRSVSQIITYGTMAAKAVVRDVGRVLGHPYGFVDQLAKLIPFELGITLDKALDEEELLRERYNKEEDVRILIDLARKLEGITRNVGKHAGGVVIAPTKLTDFSPLYCEPDSNLLVTQYDKHDVEAVGLVKFDFLGLRTLTIIDWAVQAINQELTRQNKELLDISAIPMDDPATFALLKSCKTTAVFQLESRGMKDLVKRLQPDCFEEIVALVALFRPGPLQSGMVDDFIDRKHGRAEVVFPHAKLEPILSPTYGVILYQEQVMQIAQVLAGYSLGGADILRKAMGKKIPKEMAKQRKVFVTGAVANGIPEIRANFIFDLMEKFAGYGFNKSHSAAYALLAYQTAWLKTHYPSEFMAAVLSSDMDNTDKLVRFIEECYDMKLKLCAPNINRGDYKFKVVDGEIIYGIGAVKGVGEAAVESILSVRQEGGEFTDLFDFCRRVDLRKVNHRVLEALIKSGAMDLFGVHRASLLASLDDMVHRAEQYLRDKEVGQDDMFGVADQHSVSQVSYVDVPESSDRERLVGEKETLGFYLSGHPIDQYEKELTHIVTSSIADLKVLSTKVVVMAGIVVDIRTMQNRRGDRIAFVTLDDGTGRLDVSFFSDVYNDYRPLLQKDNLIIVEGEASLDDYNGRFRVSAKRALTMTEARANYAKHLLLSISEQKDVATFVDKLRAVLKPHKGDCRICVSYQKKGARALLPLSSDWRVEPTDELLKALRDSFPESEVEACY